MKRVIVTGATGVIGMSLVKELLKNDCEVTVICHRNSARKRRLEEWKDKTFRGVLSTVDCDLDEIKSLVKRLESGYDIWYHMAWEGTTGTSRNNVEMQLRNVQFAIDAVETAKNLGCRRFVGLGSQAEYGMVEDILNEQTAAEPKTGYGIGKLAAGHFTRLRCGQLGIEHIWVRVLSVYGPYDTERSLVMSAIRLFLSGKAFDCTGAEQIWDYLYAEDAARALILLGSKGKSGEVYVLGSGRGEILRDYIEKIRKAVAQNIEKGKSIVVPEANYGAIPYGENQVMHLVADISKIHRDTEFLPEISFEEGIRKTVAWCRKEYT